MRLQINALQKMVQFSMKHNHTYLFALLPHLLLAWSTMLQNKLIVFNVQVILYLGFISHKHAAFDI